MVVYDNQIDVHAGTQLFFVCSYGLREATLFKSVQGWEPEGKIRVPRIRRGEKKKFRITFFIFPEICPNLRTRAQALRQTIFFFWPNVLAGSTGNWANSIVRSSTRLTTNKQNLWTYRNWKIKKGKLKRQGELRSFVKLICPKFDHKI